jgi:hypothetical protein
LVCLSVGQFDAASFIRRFLKHPAFGHASQTNGQSD